MQYHIARNGQQAGTFSEDEVRARLRSNEFSPADLCWTEGMTDWQPLGVRFAHAAAQPAGAALNPYAPPQAAIMSNRGAAAGELASLGERLLAAILDGVAAMVLMVPLFIGVALSADRSGSGAHEPPPLALGLMGFTGLALIGLMIYNLVLLATRGQTIGKKWMSIRIVTHPDGANPGGVKTIVLRGLVNGLIGAVPLFGPIYALVDLGFIFREDRRCIHDLIAGTMVVKGQPPGV